MTEQRKEYYTHHDNGFKCIRCGYKWYNFDPCCEYPKKYQDHATPELAGEVEKQEPAHDPDANTEPEFAWILLTNICEPGKFKASLEINGQERELLHQHVGQDEGIVSNAYNITWIIDRAYQRGLAAGEAKSVQWVLEFMMGEYARTGNFPGPSEISDEASRRNIKITKGE